VPLTKKDTSWIPANNLNTTLSAHERHGYIIVYLKLNGVEKTHLKQPLKQRNINRKKQQKMHSGVQKLPRLVMEGLMLIMWALQMAMLDQNELRMCALKMSMIGSK